MVPKKNAAVRDLIETLESSVDRELVHVDNLPEDIKLRKLADLKEMIGYYSGMTDRIDDKRVRLHDLSMQLLAVAAAGLGVLLVEGRQICAVASWSIGSVLGVQILVSFVSLLTYVLQCRFPYYPFKHVDRYGNRWKWFYPGNPHISHISSSVYPASRAAEETVIPYLRGLTQFLKSYASEDTNQEIRDGLLQLFLLQVHNYYKNRFYLHLVRQREWGLYMTMGAAFLGAIVGWRCG